MMMWICIVTKLRVIYGRNTPSKHFPAWSSYYKLRKYRFLRLYGKGPFFCRRSLDSTFGYFRGILVFPLSRAAPTLPLFCMTQSESLMGRSVATTARARCRTTPAKETLRHCSVFVHAVLPSPWNHCPIFGPILGPRQVCVRLFIARVSRSWQTKSVVSRRRRTEFTAHWPLLL